jgi:hypothetical protein
MYNSIKSCIVYNDNKSDFFSSEVGVRQGENLSPFLFAVFLNDFEGIEIQYIQKINKNNKYNNNNSNYPGDSKLELMFLIN